MAMLPTTQGIATDTDTDTLLTIQAIAVHTATDMLPTIQATALHTAMLQATILMVMVTAITDDTVILNKS